MQEAAARWGWDPLVAVCAVCRGLSWRSGHSSGSNAYLRRVHDEKVAITHPCHPLFNQSVSVLHYRQRSQDPSIIVELPDGSAREIPVSWTNRAVPSIHLGVATEGLRLCPYALLEAVEWAKRIQGKRLTRE